MKVEDIRINGQIPAQLAKKARASEKKSVAEIRAIIKEKTKK